MGRLLLTVLLAVTSPASSPTTRPAGVVPQTAAEALRPVCEALDRATSEEDKEENDAISSAFPADWQPMPPLTPAVLEVLARVQPQLDALAEAAKLPAGGGQWLDPDDDPPAAASWAWTLVTLSRLAAADAVRRADAGDAAGASARLQSVLAVSKLLVDLPYDLLIVEGRRCAADAIPATARIAATLTDEQAAALRDAYLDLRKTAEVEAMRRQGRDVERCFRDAPTPYGDPAKVDPLILALLNPPPDARAKWEDLVERDRMIRSLRLAYEASADALAATGDARAAKLAEAGQRVADAGWLGPVFGPASDLMATAQTRFDTLFTLAAAGLDVRLRGPAALADDLDPTDGKAFEYAPLDGGGFVLTSRHAFKDKPLTFRVQSVGVAEPARVTPAASR